MSPEIEYEGNNVQDAINRACEDLNLTPDQIKHDIISHGSTGIFGLVGTKKARIRVRLPEPQKETRPEADTPKSDEDLTAETLEAVRSLVESTFEDVQAPPPEPAVDIEGIVESGKEALQKIVDAITTDAKVSVKEKSSEQILYQIEGGNSAIMIGKRGQTLEAMQYLIEKIANKNNAKRVRIEIDIEDYLKNRKDNLERLAYKLAEKAKRTGKPMTVGHMNAHDRRIVHLALKDDKKIRTQSMGEGLNRKLVIFPKKNTTRNRKRQLAPSNEN